MLAAQNILLFLGCAAFPLYLLPSGGIQLAHVLFACAAFLALLSNNIRFSPQAALLLVLAVLGFSREAVAAFAGAPPSSVVQGAFVVFNMTTLVAIQTLIAQTGSAAPFRWGAVAAAAVALAPLLATGIDFAGERIEERAIGTFRNPNQLAYFATILFSITVLLRCFGELSGRITIALVCTSFVLIFAALSKAGIVGMFIGLALFCAGTGSGRWLAVLGVVGLVLLYHLGMFDPGQLLFVQRFQDIGADPDDGLVERGYLVLLEGARQPLEIWFGLGEHGVRAVNDGHEIHSTYLTFFGLYGMAGGLLYLAFLGSWAWVVLRSLPIAQAAAILSPPLLYGIAHNGTRFSILYVLVALSLSLCEQRCRRPLRPVRRLSVGPADEARPFRPRPPTFRSRP